METLEFQAWPKIARLNRDMIITEKIDGTNAAVLVTDDGQVGAQSRSRLITPEQDNHGFARWVYANAEALAKALGPGRHFGEWWGGGIQRGYGLAKDDKRFSLFNLSRYAECDFSELPNVALVPKIYSGPFDSNAVVNARILLEINGSYAAPGYTKPEGIVVFHVAANQLFKVTLENDEQPKGLAS